eukprot:TRINITY_DN33113_c0_g1_i1.p1 TRINITY_DN33113_c0_g1~~TRINITY_DN33113_c0_g1_i1.p1  ORF type:complete len:352 (+),score=53.57 TRINITY_DN33113_c0_g1_i1:50-1057(+)
MAFRTAFALSSAPASAVLSSTRSRFAPEGATLTAGHLDRLVDFVSEARGSLVAITGAGCSTESGVPDYRSPEGSYSKGHRPMMHGEFTKSRAQRARYWARSLRGWRLFSSVQPNDSHWALAALERSGHLASIVTQNVDGLHLRAGSQNVVELHGRNDEVECRSCSARRPRADFQLEVESSNTDWIAQHVPKDWSEQDLRADGDAHLSTSDFLGFHVPSCHRCGGVMMPRVVFFGGALVPEVRDAAQRCVTDASHVLVLGTSCQVFSAFRLVKAAAADAKPVALVSIGETRIDPLLHLKMELRCGEALASLCDRLSVPLVRGINEAAESSRQSLRE